jgi:hypothetical protein
MALDPDRGCDRLLLAVQSVGMLIEGTPFIAGKLSLEFGSMFPPVPRQPYKTHANGK